MLLFDMDADANNTRHLRSVELLVCFCFVVSGASSAYAMRPDSDGISELSFGKTWPISLVLDPRNVASKTDMQSLKIQIKLRFCEMTERSLDRNAMALLPSMVAVACSVRGPN